MEIEKIIKTHKIFIDTCSFMDKGASVFFEKKLAPILAQSSEKIIIPKKVIDEINKHQRSNNSRAMKYAKIGARIVKGYRENKLAIIRGEVGEGFADNVFMTVFTKFRLKHNLVLITQDENLAMEISQLSKQKSVTTDKEILCLRLNEAGSINKWCFDKKEYKIKNAFRHDFKKPKIDQNKQISVSKIPSKNQRVFSKKLGALTLTEEIGKGGEGLIYKTSNNTLACKVYFKEKITKNRLEKLKLMISNDVKIKGVCWPTDIVFNEGQQFVGYIMPKAVGTPMQKCMFVKPLLAKFFPHWDKKNLVTLAINLLRMIIELHKLNIIIGDINPLNILVESENELYFVDTDSYQIENFPCPVGMVNFTAPEIQGKKYIEFLRTKEQENFAVATMLFMILLPGKPPYSHQGGGDSAENIRKGIFAYPLGDKSSKKTPDGPWRFIWSHLPYKTKEAFYNTFSNEKRIDPDEWFEQMESYQYSLEKGHMDPVEGNKLFPTTFKRVSDHAKKNYGAKENFFQESIEFICNMCSRHFFVSKNIATGLKKMSKNKILCPDCHEKKKQEHLTGNNISCTNCGQIFLFSYAEQKFFAEKDFDAPKRCKNCRGSHNQSRSYNNHPETRQEQNYTESSSMNLLEWIFDKFL